MDYRRASRIAEWTLVAAVVLLHLAIFLWPETGGQPQVLVQAAHDAQLLSGIVLILGWCILGPGSPWLRGGALPVLAILWFLPWNDRIMPRETTIAFQITLTATAAVVIGGLRLCGFRMRRLDPGAGPERGAQFSLLGLLLATTLIAALIGGLEALRPTMVQDRSPDLTVFLGEISRTPQQVREIVLAVAVALSAIGGLWVVARPGAAWFRLGAIALALPIAAVYLAFISSEPDQRIAVATNLGLGLSLIAGLAGLTVLPLRLLDYRLQRPAPAAARAAMTSPAYRRLSTRAAAIALAVGLVAILAFSKPLSRALSARLSPPARSFAAWIQPRDRLALQRTYRLQIRSASVQRMRVTWRHYVEPLPARPLEINGWEYRRLVEAPPDSNSTTEASPAGESIP